MKKIKVNIKNNNYHYPIIIGSNIVSKFNQHIKENKLEISKYFIVVDKNVPKRMIVKLTNSITKAKVIIHYFEAKEKNKIQKNVDIILNKMLKKNFTRTDCLVAIGGGITGDVAAYAASLFKRGINFVNVPTTFLSQVDSSIGGKTGVNTENGKNLIGTFYQPNIVIIDTEFLKTLEKRQIVCGYAEILKHSVIANKKFYKYLDKNFDKVLNLESPHIEKSIFESCMIKKTIVEKDEKETGLRKTLNFGHTFAHAYEATLNYSKKLNHGEAVILGMKSALNFSYKKKLISAKIYKNILAHMSNADLNYSLSDYFTLNDIRKIISYMSNDKKNNSSRINLILLKRIGSPIISKSFNKKYFNSFLKKELSY